MTVRAWREADSGFVMESVIRRASSAFTGAIRRYGLTAEDIVMEGVAKLLASNAADGSAPSKELLWWAAHNAGLDMIRASARRVGDGASDRRSGGPGTVTHGDEAGLAELRRSLVDRSPRVVPWSSWHRPASRDPLADSDVARPDDLVWETICWQLVAERIRPRPATCEDRCVGVGSDPRARFAALSDQTAYRLAHRAAADVEIRRAYAEQPGITVWGIAREVAPDELGHGSPQTFPSHSHQADRRRAFRLVRRVTATVEGAHREIEAEVRADEALGQGM